MSTNTTITFLVNGEKLGIFVFERLLHPKGQCEFTCYTKSATTQDQGDGACIQISITKNDVHLDDYFYYANLYGYECEKPDSWEKHKMILNTLLEFLAYAFQKQRISLQDAASRKYTHCPPLYTGIHLVAGHQSIYQRAAGFTNTMATTVGDQVGALTIPEKLNSARGTTLREIALSIIQTCKEEQHPISLKDTMLISYIQTEFQEAFLKANNSYFLDYYKTTMNMYGCRIKHADDMVDGHLIDAEILEPGDPIKEYLFIDIITP